MLIFTQFCRALVKINFFKNCRSGIWGWRFSYNIFWKFWGFWGSFSYKYFSYKKNKKKNKKKCSYFCRLCATASAFTRNYLSAFRFWNNCPLENYPTTPTPTLILTPTPTGGTIFLGGDCPDNLLSLINFIWKVGLRHEFYKCFSECFNEKWSYNLGLKKSWFQGHVILRARYARQYSQNIHNYYNCKIFLEYFETISEINVFQSKYGGWFAAEPRTYIKEKWKRRQWGRTWIRKRGSKGPYYSIINDLRLTDKENFWKKISEKPLPAIPILLFRLNKNKNYVFTLFSMLYKWAMFIKQFFITRASFCFYVM